MKKLFGILLSVLTLNSSAQTTQGVDPSLISDICVVSYIHTDTTGFHWTLTHSKATSPNVVFYTLDKLVNNNWEQQVFHTAQDASVFILDTIAFDSTSVFQLTSYDSAQNTVYQTFAKPMFIHTVEESVTHTALTFSSYLGFTPSYYIIYRGNSPVTLMPYDSIGVVSGAAITSYFDPEADSYSHYYQIGAVRPFTCDESNNSGWAAYNGIALSDIVLAGTVGVNENQALLNAITLYPNPTQNLLTVNLGKAANSAVNVNVLNPMGQVVKTQAFDKTAGQKLSLDIAALPSGIYFVQVQAFGGVKALRLIKE